MSNSKDEGISELLTLLERELRVFTIGDTIQIKGKLSFFREKWKVFAHTICNAKSFTKTLTFKP